MTPDVLESIFAAPQVVVLFLLGLFEDCLCLIR